MSNNLAPYHTLNVAESLGSLKSAIKGLSMHEVLHRLKVYGHNEIPETKENSRFKILIGQFKNSIVLLLFAAAFISFLFKDYTECLAILAVILINAIIGYILESQAMRSMEALKKLDKVFARVMREGQVKEIDAREIVPGDILLLEAGDIVPADARLLELAHLETNESTLTGESVPVSKNAKTQLESDTVLADRINMVFKGTSVNRGNAKALVVATGSYTEMGHISAMVAKAEKEEIPLNKKLDIFSKKLIWLTILIIIPFVVVGLIRGNEMYLMIETAIALAVAAIPEGLPIVATISLARGMLKLSGSNVIVKKLAAVETLGETDIIMTDKTGTLTENKLKTEVVLLTADDPGTLSLENFIKVAVLCNNASFNDGVGIGDPVETALLTYVNQHDKNALQTLASWIEVDEKPFDSEKRYMATLHENNNKYFASVKGSTTEVLELCQSIDRNGETLPFKDEERNYWVDKTSELAGKGYKVLAFAYRKLEEEKSDYYHDLVFVGLAGFLDPPRKDVKASIQQCHEAGIKIIMVTGDHQETARAISEQISLVPLGVEINAIHGKDLVVSDKYKAELDSTQIYSRVTPKQKLELVEYFQSKNLVIGMTGDGVNDAPALRKADIGIAMGLRGTQVAEEAADMVLQDDSFSSIVVAIKQGRVIFNNIKNFVIYLLSCNLTEIMVVAIAVYSNVALPLLPLQILFLNLVTDVFPALALGMGEGSPYVMKSRGRDPQDPLINFKNWISIVVYSAVMTLCILGVFFYSTIVLKNDPSISNNIAFFTLAFMQLWHPFNLIHRQEGFFKNEITRNGHLWLAILFCTVILILAYATPLTQVILGLTSLTTELWFYIIGTSFLPLFIIRFLKLLKWVR